MTDQELKYMRQTYESFLRSSSTQASLLTHMTSNLETFDDLQKKLNSIRGKELRAYTDQLNRDSLWRNKHNQHLKEVLANYKAQAMAHADAIKEQRKAYNQAKQDRAYAIKWGDAIKLAKAQAIIDAFKELSKQQRKYVREMEKSEGDLRSLNWGDAKKNMVENLGKSVSSGITKLLSGITLGSALADISDAYKKGVNTGGFVDKGDVNSIARNLGLTPAQYIQLQADNRQAVLAAGGYADTLKLLGEGERTYLKTVWNQADRTKAAAEQMTIFTRAGVRPAAGQLQKLSSQFDLFQKITGEGIESFDGHIRDIILDGSTQVRLRAAASEQERQQIVLSAAQRLKENVALGMIPEQAKAVAKALNKLAGESPIERFKRAAKMRAFGAAMGIDGTDDAAKAIIAGQRATPEQQKMLQEFLSRSSNAMSASQTGSIAGEIFTGMLGDKTGMTQLAGPQSEFNTVLAQSVQPNIEKLTAVNEEYLPQVSDGIKKLHSFFESVRDFFTKDPMVKGGTAIGLSAIGSIAEGGVQGLIEGLILKKVLGGYLGAGAGAAGGGAAGGAAAAGGAGMLARVLPFLGKAGGVGLAGGIGYGVGTLAYNAGLDNLLAGWFQSDAEKSVNADLKKPQFSKMRQPGTPTTQPTTPKTETSNDQKEQQEEKKKDNVIVRIDRQIEKLDKSNDLLEQIAESTKRNVELSEMHMQYVTKGDTSKFRASPGKFYASFTGLTA